jgi:hypothetical protein
MYDLTQSVSGESGAAQCLPSGYPLEVESISRLPPPTVMVDGQPPIMV